MAKTQRAERKYIKTSFISIIYQYQFSNSTEKVKGPTRDLIFRCSARFQSNIRIEREKVIIRKSAAHREDSARRISSTSCALLQVSLLNSHFLLVQLLNYHYGNSLISSNFLFLSGNSHVLVSLCLDLSFFNF